MHLRVYGSDIACDTIVPVNRTRTTQNARSAIMGESSAADVGLSSLSRMVLVALLAFTYCFTACQAKLPTAIPPVYLPESLGGMVRGDGFSNMEPMVPFPFSGRGRLENEDRRSHPDFRSTHDFIVAKIRAKTPTSNKRNLGEGKTRTTERLGTKQHDDRSQSSFVKNRAQRKASLEIKRRSSNLTKVKEISDAAPAFSTAKTSSENTYESSLELNDNVHNDNKFINEDNVKGLHLETSAQRTGIFKPSEVIDLIPSSIVSLPSEDKLAFEADAFTNENDITAPLESVSNNANYIQENGELITDYINNMNAFSGRSEQNSMSGEIEIADQTRSKHVNNSLLHIDAPHVSGPAASMENTYSDQTPNGGDLNELRSLIQDTLKKMELRLEKIHNKLLDRRVASARISIPDANDFVDETVDTYTEISKPTILSWKDAPEFHIFDVDNMDIVEDENEDEFSPLELREYEDHATAVILQAIETQTIPEDFEFWQNVSKFLDNDYNYLSRTKRRARRWKSRRRFSPRRHAYQRLRHRLSITYSHVVPCAIRDRFYCMNGGTCVFVDALDIKTCRCPIGYTGVRCQMIDQEYILRLLTDSIVFSSEN